MSADIELVLQAIIFGFSLGTAGLWVWSEAGDALESRRRLAKVPVRVDSRAGSEKEIL